MKIMSIFCLLAISSSAFADQAPAVVECSLAVFNKNLENIEQIKLAQIPTRDSKIAAYKIASKKSKFSAKAIVKETHVMVELYPNGEQPSAPLGGARSTGHADLLPGDSEGASVISTLLADGSSADVVCKLIQ